MEWSPLNEGLLLWLVDVLMRELLVPPLTLPATHSVVHLSPVVLSVTGDADVCKARGTSRALKAAQTVTGGCISPTFHCQRMSEKESHQDLQRTHRLCTAGCDSFRNAAQGLWCSTRGRSDHHPGSCSSSAPDRSWRWGSTWDVRGRRRQQLATQTSCWFSQSILICERPAGGAFLLIFFGSDMRVFRVPLVQNPPFNESYSI